MSFTTALVYALCACVIIFIADSLYGRYFTKAHKYLNMIPRLRLDTWLVFLVSLIVMLIFCYKQPNPYVNYCYQAESFLHGHLALPSYYPDYLERVKLPIENPTVQYLHFAPMPAVVVLPFVWLFGLDFPIAYLSAFLGAASITFFYMILGHLKIKGTRVKLWSTMLFGFGTVFFFLVAQSRSWFFGQTCGVFFILLAIYLVVRASSKYGLLFTFLSGLAFGAAVSCRMPYILSVFLFLIFIWKQKEKKWLSMLLFLCGAAIPGGLYMAFDYARYGTIMDIGYSNMLQQGHPGDTDGPMNVKYMWNNIYSIFLLAPTYQNTFPYLVPGVGGVSITLTSPALFYSLRAKGEKWLIWLLWFTVILTAIPFLLNWGNGMAQFGMRYSMDFTPFLMLLVAMALRKVDSIQKFLILVCVLVNAWGVLFWNMLANVIHV